MYSFDEERLAQLIHDGEGLKRFGGCVTRAEARNLAHDMVMGTIAFHNVEDLECEVQEQAQTINDLENDKEGLERRIRALEEEKEDLRKELASFKKHNFN
jgi:predicted RNase H-like nuclease (RuvC/YqgF family)